MRDLVGILGALGLVRLFWDAVFKWHDFYERHWGHPGPVKPEVPQSEPCAPTKGSSAN